MPSHAQPRPRRSKPESRRTREALLIHDTHRSGVSSAKARRSEQAIDNTAKILDSVDDLTKLLGSDEVVAPESGIVYRSQIMRQILDREIQFADSTAAVLISGEPGTGKELLARLVHDRSSRRFVEVNCAALSEGLFESELFGHVRGTFTGALADRSGRFEWAGGGTLLLDEISEIPVTIQAKLLRVLEEQAVQTMGDNESLHVDVCRRHNQSRSSRMDSGRPLSGGFVSSDQCGAPASAAVARPPGRYAGADRAFYAPISR